MSGSTRPDILLFSTADWDNPYWTNKQHVAVELARRGHRVLYVESAGLRRPSATTRDLRRIWRRLKRGFIAPRQVDDKLWVLSPLSVPLQGSPFVRRLNRFVISAAIGFWSRRLGLATRILWTYSPLTTEFLDTQRWPLMVYHAVDDIKAQPGMPQQAIEASEHALALRADIIFTTAHHIQAELARVNPETHYFSNVADFFHFNRALAPETLVPGDIAALPQPRIGFVGAISGYKVDFGLLRAMADARPNWSFVLIGEIGEGDPWTDVSMLEGARNIHLLGGRAYSSLPGYLKAMDAAILPCPINDYTRSMFPMKFFEYLAAGRAVVSTPLPALAGFDHVAEFAADAPAFVTALEAVLAKKAGAQEARISAAQGQTYRARTEKMMTMVERLGKF